MNTYIIKWKVNGVTYESERAIDTFREAKRQLRIVEDNLCNNYAGDAGIGAWIEKI